VAGTHGKTTTTAMLAWILEVAGRRPSFLVGGIAENFGRSFQLADGPDFVIEGDDRLTIRDLIACLDERIERQGIIIRCGELFFNQRSDHTYLCSIQQHIHRLPFLLAGDDNVWNADICLKQSSCAIKGWFARARHLLQLIQCPQRCGICSRLGYIQRQRFKLIQIEP